MKHMKSLVIFASILTLLAYTGCGADYDNAGIVYEKSDSSGEVVENYMEEADAYDDADAVYEKSDSDGEDVENYVEEEAVYDDADVVAVDDAKDDGTAMAYDFKSETVSSAKVGMLTAGEWRDHDNWGFFSNLVNTGVIAFPSFGIDPTQRIAVTVTDNDGTPLPNVDVILNQDESTVLWHSKTDKNGIAYVFETNGWTGQSITAQQGELSETVAVSGEGTTDEQGNVLTADRTAEIKLDTAPVTYSNTEVMFIVDTTGSMGDEMLYLQSDFAAIAEEIGSDSVSYSVNFYKDEDDEYVTKCSGFTTDIDEIKARLTAEAASGGGDEPEAIAEIFAETLSGDMWSEESVKIAFLIYDAPPHDGKEAILQQAISDASAKGIHLIPVVSSNDNREAELFGRAIAICTNGSYVFLTDDSGIGNSHLEPIIGDYEVESLHDIIVRIIHNYQQV